MLCMKYDIQVVERQIPGVSNIMQNSNLSFEERFKESRRTNDGPACAD
jgi:hypothetical protein